MSDYDENDFEDETPQRDKTKATSKATSALQGLNTAGKQMPNLIKDIGAAFKKDAKPAEAVDMQAS